MQLRAPLQFGKPATNASIGGPGDSQVTIPTNMAGNPAEYAMVICDVLIGIQPIQSGETPALSTMARLRPNWPLVINVKGYTHIRFGFITTAQVAISPLENH